MADVYQRMFEALKQTADGLILANEGIKKTADAALAARTEHDDLRESLRQLQALVLELVNRLPERGSEQP